MRPWATPTNPMPERNRTPAAPVKAKAGTAAPPPMSTPYMTPSSPTARAAGSSSASRSGAPVLRFFRDRTGGASFFTRHSGFKRPSASSGCSQVSASGSRYCGAAPRGTRFSSCGGGGGGGTFDSGTATGAGHGARASGARESPGSRHGAAEPRGTRLTSGGGGGGGAESSCVTGATTTGATHLLFSQTRSPLQSVSFSQPVPPKTATTINPIIAITPSSQTHRDPFTLGYHPCRCPVLPLLRSTR